MGAAIYRKGADGNMARVRKASVKGTGWTKAGKTTLMELVSHPNTVEIIETMSAPVYMWQNGESKCVVSYAWGDNTMVHTRTATQLVKTLVSPSGSILSADYYNMTGDSTVFITVSISSWSIHMTNNGDATYDVSLGVPIFLTYSGYTVEAGRRINL